MVASAHKLNGETQTWTLWKPTSINRRRSDVFVKPVLCAMNSFPAAIGGAEPEDAVESGDRPGCTDIGDVVQPVRDDEFGDLLQIGQRDERQTARFEHSMEFCQGDGHLMSKQVFDIVRRPDGIDGIGPNRTHVGQGGHDIGPAIGVNVQPQFFPLGRSKPRVQMFGVRESAADVENRFQPGLRDAAGITRRETLPGRCRFLPGTVTLMPACWAAVCGKV